MADIRVKTTGPAVVLEKVIVEINPIDTGGPVPVGGGTDDLNPSLFRQTVFNTGVDGDSNACDQARPIRQWGKKRPWPKSGNE